MSKTLHRPRNKIFLAMLRALRLKRGLRQADLAHLLGWHQEKVSRVERGERRLDFIELQDWLGALELDIVDFARAFDGELHGRGVAGGHSVKRKPASRRDPVEALLGLLMAAESDAK